MHVTIDIEEGVHSTFCISFATVNDVTKPSETNMYSGSEGHNTKYKLYVRSNEGNEYALSLLS